MGIKYHTEAGVECTPEECKIEYNHLIIYENRRTDNSIFSREQKR